VNVKVVVLIMDIKVHGHQQRKCPGLYKAIPA